MSEFSTVQAMGRGSIVSRLCESSNFQDRRLLRRLLKTAASLAITTSNHGGYVNADTSR